MLKIRIENAEVHIERAVGSLRTICAETCLAIRGLYDTVRKDNAEAAEKIRKTITECVNNEEFWSMQENDEDEEDEETSFRVDWDAIRKTIERGGAAGK